MNHGLYRKLPKNRCIGCDHPTWAPCKKINPKKACDKCAKLETKHKKKHIKENLYI